MRILHLVFSPEGGISLALGARPGKGAVPRSLHTEVRQ